MLCRRVEKEIFSDPKVRETFRKFVVVAIYQDERGRQDEFTDLQLRLVQTLMLPTYAVVDPETELVVRKWGYDPLNLTAQAYIDDLTKGLRAVEAMNGK